MIICDTSGLIAANGHQSSRDGRVLQVLEAEARSLVLSPFVLAETRLPDGQPVWRGGRADGA
jgi:hypothetical protein